MSISGSLIPVLALGLSAHSFALAAPDRPNVVLVVVDDLRFDDLGAAGHPFVKTPHIDRLAREGARFTEFFATTPLCSPSRANILTGLYTRHHGILDNTDRSARSHALPSSALRTAASAGAFAIASATDTPTTNRNIGKIRSVGVQPFQAECASGAWTWPQSPG